VAFGALAQAYRVAVPDRRAVRGAGDFELSSTRDPPLTGVTVEGARIGRNAEGLCWTGWTARRRRRVCRCHFIVERASS
jgi:DNA-binding LacI/PurR family transcriptional regulator